MSVKPRRVFASSVVVTLAGTFAIASAAPTEKEAPIRKNPPPPKKDPPPKVAPAKDRHWRLFQQDKDCFAADADACPPMPKGQPVPPCNPPPPTKYACPQNVTLPVNVVQRSGTTDCFVDWGPTKCPEGAKCNPPPPRKIACP